MKAALLSDWKKVEMVDLPMPEPGPGEALIKIIYGGVCGSDITVFKGMHPTATKPVVLCHEILGTVEKLPDDYKGNVKIGDRVVVNPVIPCGHCVACRNDQGNVCSSLKLLGIHVNGGFEEYTKAAADMLVPVDPSLSDELAVLSEPFAVGYHVNKRAGVKAGDNALIIGAGTIGMVVALVARSIGARVVISEMNPGRIKEAQEFGFETIDIANEDFVTRAMELSGEGFDLVYEASGSKAGVMTMTDVCRPGGTLVSLSMSSALYEFPIGKISFNEFVMIGSRLYSHEDFTRGVELVPKILKEYDLSKLIAKVMPLDEVPEAIELMMSGTCNGKILIRA